MAERINAVKTSFFGKGAIRLLGPELQKMGIRRALLVTDRFLYDSGAAARVGQVLSDAGVEYAVYYNVQPNPTVQVVNDCIAAARTLQVQLLVGGQPQTRSYSLVGEHDGEAYRIAVKRLDDGKGWSLAMWQLAQGDRLPPPGVYDRIVQEVERPLISICLAATRGNQIRAAQLLGLNRNTLRKKIRDLGLEVIRGLRSE